MMGGGACTFLALIIGTLTTGMVIRMYETIRGNRKEMMERWSTVFLFPCYIAGLVLGIFLLGFSILYLLGVK